MARPTVEFFFETSALVTYYHYENGSKTVRFWINDLRTARNQPAQFFVPNVSIPEVLHVCYVFRHIKNKLTEDDLNHLRATFLHDLEHGKLTVCELVPQDVLATQALYELAHQEFRARHRTSEALLSPMDILILAMAHNFKAHHPRLFLVTADAQMVRVARRIGLHALNPTDYPTIPQALKP